MGRDKAGLEFEGEPLAVRVLRVLRDVSDEILVASGDGERLAWLGERQIPDMANDAGPLAGLIAGLDAATAPLVTAVAVDMPYASAPVLRLLVDAWDGEDAVAPRTERGLEPLHAVYASSAAAKLRSTFDAGERAIHRALVELQVREIGPEEWFVADPTGRFALNLNRPQDLRGSPPGQS
jgi:molybdopterin-guanine dinucleotide biosynthesis protein A